MKKGLFAAVLAFGLVMAGMAYAQGPGYGYGGGYGGMGPGMMGYYGGSGYGYGGMGPGMMGYYGGSGYGYGGMGPGMMGYYGGNGYGYGCPAYGAYGYGHSGYGPYGWNGYQNGWNNEKYQKFLNDTEGLRRQLNDKGFEYQEALRNPNSTKESLAQIQKDINKLQAEINEKAQQEQ